MKKKIIVAAVAAIVAVGAAWNLNQKADSNAISDLTLNNVEALAGEGGGMAGFEMPCYDKAGNPKNGDYMKICYLSPYTGSCTPKRCS